MKKIIKNKLAILSTLLALSTTFTSFSAQAGSATFVLTPQATLSGICIIGVGNINFGTIQAGSNNVSASTQLNVLCTKGTTFSWEVLFSASDYAKGQAHMVGATYGDSLPFGAFQANGTAFTGNGIASDYVNDTGTGLIQTYSIVAKISTVPYVHPDNYSDIISVSLKY